METLRINLLYIAIFSYPNEQSKRGLVTTATKCYTPQVHLCVEKIHSHSLECTDSDEPSSFGILDLKMVWRKAGVFSLH